METQITVLIVDDHTLVRHGIRNLLSMQHDMQVIGDVATGEQAIALAARHRPQVALVDLLMPGGMNGVMTTREIKRVSPQTQVVILTSFHTDEHIFPALRAGALSYVLKDMAPDALTDAVRRAAAGDAIMSERIADRLAHVDADDAKPEDPFALLSPRELDVLRLIAVGTSNSAIAKALVLSEHTVKGYVSTVLSKLHVTDRTQAAAIAWRDGLIGPNSQE
jgi:two-component system, NarL family, response regulator LiaR